jgi:hypothetical protein
MRRTAVVVLHHRSLNRRGTAKPRCRRARAVIARHVAASRQQEDHRLKFHLLSIAVIVAAISAPLTAAQAQGIPDGAAHGAYVGNNAAGPIGAVVGGAVGGVIGGVEGGIAGVFGVHPVAASYPAAEPPVYHRHRLRHSYRHGYRTHAAS